LPQSFIFNLDPHITLIRKTEQTIAQWSGGTTTQLFIYPKEATYAGRNFGFRISTATVETEQSTFTSLPGVSRILMILDGTLTITHRGQYSKILNVSDMDSFDGGWQTSALGKVTDFNLMTTGNTKGKLEYHTLQAGDTFSQLPGSDFTGYYLLSGTAIINVHDKEENLHPGDFIMIQQGLETIHTRSLKLCTLISCLIEQA
jgi:environmental stress-induced protein Ves